MQRHENDNSTPMALSLPASDHSLNQQIISYFSKLIGKLLAILDLLCCQIETVENLCFSRGHCASSVIFATCDSYAQLKITEQSMFYIYGNVVSSMLHQVPPVVIMLKVALPCAHKLYSFIMSFYVVH